MGLVVLLWEISGSIVPERIVPDMGFVALVKGKDVCLYSFSYAVHASASCQVACGYTQWCWGHVEFVSLAILGRAKP